MQVIMKKKNPSCFENASTLTDSSHFLCQNGGSPGGMNNSLIAASNESKRQMLICL